MIRILVFLLACLPGLVYADDGSRLWLDYKPVPPPVKLQLMNDFNSIVADTSIVTLKIAAISRARNVNFIQKVIRRLR